MSTVLLYTREGCHLCEEARQSIEKLRPQLPPFDLREVDIEADDRLLTAFMERIPVVDVDGQVVCELVLDPEALTRALAERR